MNEIGPVVTDATATIYKTRTNPLLFYEDEG
jgi:hypothetical protein